MPMTVVVTCNVLPRVRGFLASCTLEIAPGVYTSPKMNKAVRERIWKVLEDWFTEDSNSSIVMIWEERSLSGGQGVAVLGVPPVELKAYDDIILTYRRPAEVSRSSGEMSCPAGEMVRPR
jgi:CRISPR-associated protein Cas2